MKKVKAFPNVLRAAIRGAVTILLVTLLGYTVGIYLEAYIGSPIVSDEITPFAVWYYGTFPGMLVAAAGAVSRTWRRGLVIGLVVDGLLFGCVACLYILHGGPFDVICWVFIVGTMGGGAAGAIGGALSDH
jgi:hypothetical protein